MWHYTNDGTVIFYRTVEKNGRKKQSSWDYGDHFSFYRGKKNKSQSIYIKDYQDSWDSGNHGVQAIFACIF